MDKLWGENNMIDASKELKDLFKATSIHKDVVIRILETNEEIGNKNLVQESISITESLSDDGIILGSCNASCFNATIAGIDKSIVGKEIEVKIKADGDEGYIPLGIYIVESAKKEIGRTFSQVTAYDRMRLFFADVREWYNSISFPISVKDLRDGLCEYLGVEQKEITLPLDTMEINDNIESEGVINGLDMLKGICEINGCFGRMDRDGKLEYISLEILEEGEDVTNILKSLPQCEDYDVMPIEGVVIKFSDSDLEYKSETNANPYVIKDNYLIYDKTEEELNNIAEILSNKISGIAYTPSRLEIIGQPYMECGDKIKFQDGNGYKYSYILKRELTGIQSLTDVIEADGEEYQSQDVNSLMDKIFSLNSETNRLKIRVTQTEDGLNLKVSKGDVSSQLSVETDEILLQGNRVVIDSDKWKVNAEGKQECSDLTITGGEVLIEKEYGEEKEYITLKEIKTIESGDISLMELYEQEYEGSISNRSFKLQINEKNLESGKGRNISDVSLSEDGLSIYTGISMTLPAGGVECNAKYKDSGFESEVYSGSTNLTQKIKATVDGISIYEEINDEENETTIDASSINTNDFNAKNITCTNNVESSTFNGYTLGAACEKSVTTSVTSGSGSLITSGGVYTALKKANIVPAADNTYQLGGDNYNYKAVKTRKVVSNSALELRSSANLSLYTGSNTSAAFVHGQDLRIVSYDSSEAASSITYANCYAKAFTQQSSKRYKDYIRDITDEDAEAILELKPVVYDYKNPENGRNCEGLFAEDVDELVPYAVSYDENGLPEGLDYSKLVPRLIKLVQTLDSRIKKLEENKDE